MNKLVNSTVYLCGSVEYDSSQLDWRADISKKLSELNIIPWNPLVKPVWFPSFDRNIQNSWKEEIRKFYSDSSPSYVMDDIWHKNAKIREFCLHLVANSNFIIVKLDKTFTVGSFFELSLCKYKPVFVISEDPTISNWLISELNFTPNEFKNHFHKDIDSLMKYLNKIDSGAIIPNNLMRWSFMTYKI